MYSLSVETDWFLASIYLNKIGYVTATSHFALMRSSLRGCINRCTSSIRRFVCQTIFLFQFDTLTHEGQTINTHGTTHLTMWRGRAPQPKKFTGEIFMFQLYCRVVLYLSDWLTTTRRHPHPYSMWVVKGAFVWHIQSIEGLSIYKCRLWGLNGRTQSRNVQRRAHIVAAVIGP